MAMGMSYAEFWDGDCVLVIPYRRADELRQERDNMQAWWQGIYIRDAILSALNGRKAKYPKEPYPLNTKASEERKEREQDQNERKVVDYMMTFAEQFNKEFYAKQKKAAQEAKEVTTDGGQRTDPRA